jgi:LysM repeat protein
VEQDELKSSSKQNKMKSFATATGGAAVKVFHEFKWGLLTLVLLMAVVITLVWSGNDAKEDAPVVAPAESSQLNFNEKENAAIIPAPLDAIPPPLPGNDWERPSQTSAAQLHSLPPLEPLLPPPTPPADFDAGFSDDFMKNSRALPVGSESAATTADQLYTVNPGDFLEKIAQQFYEKKVREGVKAILEANKDQLVSADHLRVGQVLKIPTLAKPAAPELKTETSTSAPPKSPPSVDGEVAVESGDTLERIARRFLGDGRRWTEIFELNRDRIQNPNRLMVGVSLRMPKDATVEGSVACAVRVEKVEKNENRTPVIALQDETENDVRKGSDAYLSADEMPALLNERSSSAPAWMP